MRRDGAVGSVGSSSSIAVTRPMQSSNRASGSGAAVGDDKFGGAAAGSIRSSFTAGIVLWGIRA